jgi:hypothetical protein
MIVLVTLCGYLKGRNFSKAVQIRKVNQKIKKEEK